MVDLNAYLKKIKTAKDGGGASAPGFKLHTEAGPSKFNFKPAPPVQDKGILHGTGITKKVADSQEKQLERAFISPAQKQVEQVKTNPFAKLIKKPQPQETETPSVPEPVKIPVVSLPQHAAPAISIGIELDASQKAAVAGIMQEQYSCLIGAAGTGKTTVTKVIIKSIEKHLELIDLNKARIQTEEHKEPDLNLPICFCAFTGRAVQQLKRAIPKEYHPMCNTIHATLGYHPETYYNDETEKESMRFIPAFDEFNKLPYKVYVIDEAGMLPILLSNQLFAAMPAGSRVIMIGDINQLPPVQGRSVLGFAMTKWPTFELTTIHRQALDNPIIMNAHRILQGHLPQRVPGKFDMIELNQGSVQAFNVAIAAVQKLHQGGAFDPINDALIVPQNKGEIGQVALNEKLVQYFNPVRTEDGIVINPRVLIKTGMTVVHYAVGDKVMLLQNDRERGLTNGMTGIVVSINANGSYQGVHGKGTDKEATFDPSNFDLEAVKDEAEEEGALQGEEDENKRQASHVVTVRFGQPSKLYLELKGKIDFLNGILENTNKGNQQTALAKAGFPAFKDTHEILQAIAGLEYQAQKEDSGQEVDFRTAGHYKKITHAYAFTCHKSQGGEYPTVLVLIHSTNIKMLNREWLYTAVTRAKERVVLIFNNRGLLQGINLQRVKGKTLAEKVKAFNDLQDQKDVSIPYLPRPQKWKD